MGEKGAQFSIITTLFQLIIPFMNPLKSVMGKKTLFFNTCLFYDDCFLIHAYSIMLVDTTLVVQLLNQKSHTIVVCIRCVFLKHGGFA